MEVKVRKWRYTLIIILILAAAAVFSARLVQWQILQNDEYEDIALTSTEYTVKTDAIRGEIYDVNGVALAQNKTGYKVTINKIYMPDENLNENILKLTELTESSGSKWTDELPIKLDTNGNYYFVKDKDSEIEELKSKDNLNMNPYSTAEECMARLVEKYECEKYEKKQQRDIISVRYNMDRIGYSKSNPYVFADDISERTMNIISENMQSVAGIETGTSAVRTYVNGALAPHIVGVTGLISAEEYKELESQGYGYTDEIGKLGIELAYESELRGSQGSRTYEVNPDGSTEIVKTMESKPGNSVYLTIDTKYQELAEKALKEAVKEANDYAKAENDEMMGADCVGAAVVVLNVKDFSVLCAASYPGYDLSEYYSDYNKLLETKGDPLVDRAFTGALAPGSTFKPMVAAAALQEGAITTKTRIDCEGIYTTGGLKLHCMSVHGSLNVYEAIRDSCNVFFAETARLLGIENMNLYAKRCGLGVKTGVEINESSGTLAGPEYSKLMNTDWYETSVSPAGIGQSDNQFTPLQLATYAATIANNGVRLKTHVVDKVVSYSGDEVISQTKPEVVDKMGVSEQNLKEVQKAMNMATNSYDSLSDFKLQIAGKTGTAENAGSDHANFICYAPYDNPEIAIGVMVEHGAKSYVAVNVAKKIMNEYFGLNKKDDKKQESSKQQSSTDENASSQNEDDEQNSNTASEENAENEEQSVEENNE